MYRWMILLALIEMHLVKSQRDCKALDLNQEEIPPGLHDQFEVKNIMLGGAKNAQQTRLQQSYKTKNPVKNSIRKKESHLCELWGVECDF